ncbi:ABC transporter substrate-binding protein, partial [Bifidobacteriaceae bacterium NR003]
MVNFKLKSASKRAICALCALCTAVALASCGSAQKSSSNASSTKEDTGTMRVAYLSTANYLTTLKNEKFLQEEFGKSKVTYTGPYTPVDGLTAVMSGSADATTTGTGRF